MKKLGLQIGSSFVGDYTTKGCYAYNLGGYANKAYYGTGGSVAEMTTPLGSGKFRPFGYDCLTDSNNFCINYSCCLNKPLEIKNVVIKNTNQF